MLQSIWVGEGGVEERLDDALYEKCGNLSCTTVVVNLITKGKKREMETVKYDCKTKFTLLRLVSKQY